MFIGLLVTYMGEGCAKIRHGKRGCKSYQTERLRVNGTQAHGTLITNVLFPPCLSAEAQAIPALI